MGDLLFIYFLSFHLKGFLIEQSRFENGSTKASRSEGCHGVDDISNYDGNDKS